MKDEKIVVRILPEQQEFLRKLAHTMRSDNISEAVRFCINTTEIILNFGLADTDLDRVLKEALKKTWAKPTKRMTKS